MTFTDEHHIPTYDEVSGIELLLVKQDALWMGWRADLLDVVTELKRRMQEESKDKDAAIAKLRKALRHIAFYQCPRDPRCGDCRNSELCYTEWCGGCVARQALGEAKND